MRILKLKLRGAIGIKKGLGVDEIEIDFAQFQPGLIALTGRNGSGKTTIMENLHPYRQMVSRDGSLQSHFFLKDSYRVLTFEYGGDIYESTILIDALTSGSEAYLHAYEKGGNSNVPLNDGKLTTYDQEIEKLLGTPELFFNSVFSGQKSKGVAELKPADRRKLFYELLNLNSYEVYLEKAKAELKQKELKLAEVEGEVRAINDNGFNLEEAYNDNNALLVEIENLEEKQKDIAADISCTEKEVKDIEVEVRTGDKKLSENQEKKNKIYSLQEELANLTSTNNSKISRFTSEKDDCEKLIERNEKLVENKNVIAENLCAIERTNNDLQLLQAKKADLLHQNSELQNKYSRELQSFSEIEKQLTNRQKDLALREHKINSHRKEILRAETESTIIDNSGCDSPTRGNTCTFLKNAHAYRTEIPALKDKLESLLHEYASREDSLDEDIHKSQSKRQLAEENYSISNKELIDKLILINKEIESTEHGIAVLKKTDWKKLKEEASEAEKNIQLYTERINSIDWQIKEATENFNMQRERIDKDVNELKFQIDTQLCEQLTKLRESLRWSEQQLNDLKSAVAECVEQIRNLSDERIKLSQQIQEAVKSKQKLDELTALKSFVESEIKEWTFLCKAFDKTGIPVLKLENSGIEITTIANELLSLFENKFRIVFETTSLTKDKKKMKETFDINIVEEDGVCEIGNKSGGQQVWIETAIQLAIMILLSQQGKKSETAFLDEKDGALDLDNAYAYIEMLKKAHEMSGVYNTFVITHRTELLDFIPQQVKLNNGILEVMN